MTIKINFLNKKLYLINKSYFKNVRNILRKGISLVGKAKKSTLQEDYKPKNTYSVTKNCMYWIIIQIVALMTTVMVI
jgi:DNA-binding winged helix-turn-helix (wHTH) protein